MLGATGVGGHQQIRAGELLESCVHRSRRLFQTYIWFSSHPVYLPLSPSCSEHPLPVWYPHLDTYGASPPIKCLLHLPLWKCRALCHMEIA